MKNRFKPSKVDLKFAGKRGDCLSGFRVGCAEKRPVVCEGRFHLI